MHQTGACVGCAMSQARPFSALWPLRTKLSSVPARPPDRLGHSQTVQTSAHVIYFGGPPRVKDDGDSLGGRYPDNGVTTYYGGDQNVSLLSNSTLRNNERLMCTVNP